MKPVQLAIGLVTVAALALASMFCAWHSAMERARQAAETAVDGIAYSPSGPEPVLQLPNIRGHFERGGIVVTLSNDTTDQMVVIDPDNDRLLVEYRSSHADQLPRDGALVARTLAPGEAAAPVFIHLQGSPGSVNVRFEHREPNLVCSTDVTIP